jgi:hypothetical protein
MLMVWDLHPTVDIASGLSSPVRSPDIMGSPAGGRPHPTAYVIAFPYPLISVNSHPSTSKEFLVSDCRGSIFLTDWCSDPKQGEQENWRHSSLIELVEPSMLSDTSTGLSLQWSGSVDWRRDSVDMYVAPVVAYIRVGLTSRSWNSVGAVYRSKFSIWDMSKLQGGKPCATGISFPGGGHRFRFACRLPI